MIKASCFTYTVLGNYIPFAKSIVDEHLLNLVSIYKWRLIVSLQMSTPMKYKHYLMAFVISCRRRLGRRKYYKSDVGQYDLFSIDALDMLDMKAALVLTFHHIRVHCINKSTLC